MKRLLSYILIVVNLLCMPVWASDTREDDFREKCTQAAQELFELGIIQGDENGNLRTNDHVTRAEFSAVLARVLKLSSDKFTTEFTDVVENHWAKNYINAIEASGFMKGYPDGTFRPNSNILFEEAASVLVRILGYDKSVENNGGYPWGTLLSAAEIGITRNTNISKGEILTRGILSQMLLNTLYIIPSKEAAVDGVLIDTACPNVFFVSPNGSDENEGSYIKPWKTFKKAAETLKTGQTAIFEDGKYNETEASIALRTGNITLKARNKFGAVIIFPHSDDANIIIPPESAGVSIKKFDFSENTGTNTLIKNEASGLCLSGNKIAKNISAAHCGQVFVEENLFQGNGIILENSNEVFVKGNEFRNPDTYSLYADNTNTDLMIYNNVFLNESHRTEAAIHLDNKKKQSEFSVSHCVIWNNIIACMGEGELENGILFGSVKNSKIFNNVICGAETGIKFYDSRSENIVLRNNIFSKTQGDAYAFYQGIRGFDSDYNLFDDSFPETKENNSYFDMAEFINDENDWHITSDSAGMNSGESVSDKFKGYSGKVFDLELSDRDGVCPGDQPSIGAFQNVLDPSEKTIFTAPTDMKRLEPKGKVLLEENFNRISKEDWKERIGVWQVEGGVLNQIHAVENRCEFIYNKGTEWTDYAVSADIKSPVDTDGKNVGLIFRLPAGERGSGYIFRTSGKAVQFAKWVNNSLTVVKTWEYPIENDTYYNFGVEAKGTHFTFYMNGEKIGEADDSSCSMGTVAFYTFRNASKIDNLKVAEIK